MQQRSATPTHGFKVLLQSRAVKMHKARAYQSITPANNMILKKKWDQSRFDMHRTKVKNAKPMIDNKPPETYMHLHLKLKKLQMEEERQATVERDNRILLEKMAHIMRTRGRVDNRNNYKQRSLNKTRRQRDLLRVTHENQAILKRIQSKEPHYNHLQWLDQWRVNKGYMVNISKYPHTWMHGEQHLAQKLNHQEPQKKQGYRETAGLKHQADGKHLLNPSKKTCPLVRAKTSTATQQSPISIPPIAA